MIEENDFQSKADERSDKGKKAEGFCSIASRAVYLSVPAVPVTVCPVEIKGQENERSKPPRNGSQKIC
jgi:hypothetical protein